MFYAPRGLLVDYDNYDVLSFFTEEIKKYAKKNKGIFIKIDPYLSYQERDINGDIVKDGKDNKHAFSKFTQDGLQTFWL